MVVHPPFASAPSGPEAPLGTSAVMKVRPDCKRRYVWQLRRAALCFSAVPPFRCLSSAEAAAEAEATQVWVPPVEF